ncbi:MAG: aromatic amino acid transport family protein, partial [Candidatus Paceibacteria bacterium]
YTDPTMKLDLSNFRSRVVNKIKEVTPEIGFLRQNISLFEAVALISSGTIGAGVLGIPYAVAEVGLFLGLSYVIIIGLLVTGIHLLVGDVILRTNKELQLVGLAKEYLGKKAGMFMGVLLYTMLLGTLVVYIIGEGETLAALLGGSSLVWSIAFFVFAACMVYIGLNTLKTVELILTGAILSIILLIAGLAAPHVDIANIRYNNFANLFFPYGVLLFAFHGVTFIPEAQRLLKREQRKFKQAIVISGAITIAAYTLFALAIVGVTGSETTQVATIGLGEVVGKHMLVIGNVFAAMTMATSFMVVGLTVKDSLRIDYNISNWLATAFACGIPLIIFVIGLRDFVTVIDMVGGVVVSLEMIVLVFIYWKATNEGRACPVNYRLHHSLWVVIAALAVFTIGSLYSVWNLF